jgi:4-hydroxy-L-threonine phosphate dehydrogenase PdxA
MGSFRRGVDHGTAFDIAGRGLQGEIAWLKPLVFHRKKLKFTGKL